MKKLNVLMLGLTILTAAGSAKAEQLKLLGTYEKQSGMRIFGTKEFCEAERGEYDEADGACYIFSPNGNSISIDEKLVHVETISGGQHMREFDGLITKVTDGAVEAREVNLDTGKIIKNGCVLAVIVSPDGKASLNLGKKCDSGLHIEDAKRTN